MHIYRRYKNGKIRLLQSVDTLAKMRKAKGDLAVSITTKLGIAPNPFLDRWRMEKIYHITRSNPGLSFDVVERQSWGMRTDLDGCLVESSVFGTRIHAEIEQAVLHLMDGADYNSQYASYYRPFLQWMDENQVIPTAAERMIFDADLMLAGTMDLIAEMDGKVCVFDFKTRECRGADPKSKTYPKDAMQLAIGADIIKRQIGANYNLPIYSVIIDTETCQTGVKRWTEKAQLKHLKKALATNHYYNTINDLYAS